MTRYGRLTLLLAVLGLSLGSAAVPDAKADENVTGCAAASVFVPAASPGTTAAPDGTNPCAYQLSGVSSAAYEAAASFTATAPTGLLITGANTVSAAAGATRGWIGSYIWSGGSEQFYPIPPATLPPAPEFPELATPFLAFALQCVDTSSCALDGAPTAEISSVTLTVKDAVSPTFGPTPGPNLADAPPWIRGTWPLGLTGDSPSGLCEMDVTLNGLALQGTSSPVDYSAWKQCSDTGLSENIDTTLFPQGKLPFGASTEDATGIATSFGRMIGVDNTQPTVSLSGPSSASSAAGVQYVTATATAGPSGVDDIDCNVDGTDRLRYQGASAQVPVDGVGTHSVICTAQSNAVDVNGVPATSQPALATVRIGDPTVSVAAFSKIVDQLRCHVAKVAVRLPGRWVKVRVRGRLIRVREPGRVVHVRVRRCHARTARRRIVVWRTVRRGGRTVRIKTHRTVRVLLLPHRVSHSVQRVRHGHGTTVDGWLGTTSGIALGGETVRVLTAADNGRQNFQVAAVTTTRPDGSWTARLPKGPSRIIEADYGGGPTTLGALSAPVKVVVPAEVELLGVTPQRVAWGGTVRLTGQLLGGYLPPGGALVRLRIGQGSAVTTFGVRAHVSGRGRFSTTYQFGAGDPADHQTFWFEAATLPQGDYPWAAARSGRIDVRVGGRPPAPPRSHRRRRRHRARRDAQAHRAASSPA